MSVEYTCDNCDTELELMDVAYLGPKDRKSKACNPFMEFECLCHDCEYNRDDNSED